MNNLRIFGVWMAFLALTFTSCSKEESGSLTQDQEKIQLTFGSLLADFNNANKQADPGECRDEDPSFVMVGITDSSGDYIGEDDGDDNPNVNLIEVGLKWNSSLGVWETVYSDDLALPAGNYTLQHFIVYDSAGEVLWVAPREEGTFADYVDNPLPNAFTLAAGTKPYINVEVLCYFARSEEAYGYLFFDITPVPVENSYCVFVNYCDDETGRDYPAHFEIEVWSDGYDGTPVELSTNRNTITEASTGWPAASVLCIALPDLGNDTYYARVTVLNHPDLDYTADATDTFQFTFTQADIDGQELFIPAYRHIRINCTTPGGGGDEPCNTEIKCELNTETQVSSNCEFTQLEGSNQGWVRIDSAADLDLLATVGGEERALGNADIAIVNGDNVRITLDTPYSNSDRFIAYAVEVRPRNGNVMSATCWETRCANVVREYGAIELGFDGFEYTYPFYVKVETISCF